MKDLFISDLLPEQDLQDILLPDHETGLESIRFSIADNLDRFSETLREEKERLHRLGDPPLTLHGPFLDLNPMCYDSLVRQATLRRFSQAYEAAQILGASRIVYHSGMIPTVYYLEGWAQRMADFWNHFLDGKSGITVCMENVLDRYAAPFAQVCSLVEHPDFGICLDLGHVWCYSEDPLTSWTAALDGQIRHVHVHDNHRKTDEHLAIGCGNLPFSQIIPVLAAQNPGLSWTIECSTKEDVLCSVAALEKISGRPVHSFNSTHSIVRSSN